MSKRKQLDTYTVSQTTTTISDLWSSHSFLSPNEYSSAAIGIHGCLVRCCEYEQFAKFFQQGFKMSFQMKDFLNQLNDKEKTLNNKCQLDIERCAIITRLCKYLEQNEGLFQNILSHIQIHLRECMREDPSLSNPQTLEEFIQQCNQRNKAALQIHEAHRKRRFQFYDQNDAPQSVNMINLQNWSLAHFQLFIDNITPQSPVRDQFISNLQNLLDNSFFIVQHPSPAIVTYSPTTNAAPIQCRLVCLLDKLHHSITIDDIKPYVCRVAAFNQMEEPDIFYQQPQMDWQTYKIVTATNNQRTFYSANLSEINFRQPYTLLGNQNPSKGKTHYAPFMYRIDFNICVTVRFSGDPTLYQHRVVVQSAPFGVITNTSQEADLFAKVFIQDLKTSRPSSITTDLTIGEIVDGIRRYFIHKIGIQPKNWIMPYIEKELIAVCSNRSGSIENLCHILLVKILAQINYMIEHPLLIFFHDDGLFLAICDSDEVKKNIRREHELHQMSVCAIRFGGMCRMTDAKSIGIRVDLAERVPFSDVRHYKFETSKLSNELGLYIIKINLCQASQFDRILTNLNTMNGGHNQDALKNITTFVDLYHSEKLESICPHEKCYPTIWHSFYNKENKPNDLDSAVTTTDNLPYNPWDSRICATHQPLPQQYPIIAPITSPPIIIVVANLTNYSLTNDDVTQAISTHLPVCSQLMQTSPIYRLNLTDTSFPNPQ